MASIVITPFAAQSGNTYTVAIDTLGYTDWAINNGGTSGTSVAPGTRKSGGGSLIGNTTCTSGSLDPFTGPTTFSWTGGTPTGSGSGNANIYNYDGVAKVTVPADTTTREVYWYVGAYNINVVLTATLSDASAGPSTDSSMVTGLSGSLISYGWFKVTYSAASAGQTLTLSLVGGTSGDLEPQAVGLKVISSGTSLTPGQGAVALTGQVPTVARTANQSLTPNQGALAFTGQAPTVARTANQAVTPGVGSMALTGYVPTVTQSSGTAINPGVGAITFTGYAPSISQPQALTPGAGAVSLTGFAPTVSQPQAVNPGVGSVAFTGYAASVAQTANQALSPGVGSISLAGLSPVVAQSANQVVAPDAGAVVLTGLAPTVTVASASVSLVPGAGVLTLTGYAPDVAQSRNGGIDSWGSVYVRKKKKKPEEGVAGPPIPPSVRESLEAVLAAVEPRPTVEFDEDEDEALMLLL